MRENNEFLDLAEQVRQGDAEAAARLCRSLEPRVVIIVGRALQSQSRALPLTEWIRAQARQVLRLAGQGHGPDGSGLIAQVARRVCERLVERLRAGTCSPRLLQETVCS